jgi:Ni/Co efflux regulator RcnB
MNKALLMAAALTLVAAGGAAAQEPHEDDHRPAPHAPGAHPGPAAPEAGHGARPEQAYRAVAPTHGPSAAHFDGFQGQGVGPHGPASVFYHGRTFSSFRAAPFYYPGGWGYRRWAVGQFLPGLFLTQGYFIGNWAAYSLGPPPPGLQWVRYGPDALLVNVYTGQVVDTVYGVFWW